MPFMTPRRQSSVFKTIKFYSQSNNNLTRIRNPYLSMLKKLSNAHLLKSFDNKTYLSISTLV